MTFWNHSHRKARKPHQCSMCLRTIDPGEFYMRGVGMDGDVWSWKECLHCEISRQRYDLDDGGEYSFDDLNEWSSEISGDLDELRLKAGYRHQWRTQSGALWPIPERKTA